MRLPRFLFSLFRRRRRFSRPADRDTGDRILDPVIRIEEMRQGPTSVAFAIEVRHGDREALSRTIQSIMRQTDPSWEIVLCAAPDPATQDSAAQDLAAQDLAAQNLAALVEPWLDLDWRIRRLQVDAPGGPTLIDVARVVTSDFVGMLGQGDVVDDSLLARIAGVVRGTPGAQVIYTDEARRRPDGSIGEPFYKPDWSPEHLHAVNYLGRFTALRKALVLDAAPPQTDIPEAADYAVLLDVTARASTIVHIDDVLCFRAVDAGRPIGGFFPVAAIGEARRLLERHVRRETADARVAAGRAPGALRVVWPLPAATPVTLVILTGLHRRDLPGHGRVVLATHFVRSIIAASTTPGYRILVVDDGAIDPELAGLLAAHGHDRVSFQSDGVFSFAKKANFAVGQVAGGVVILLNDDLEVVAPDWIEAMAGYALRPAIGLVGARLLFADGSLQHAGIALGFGGGVGHIFHRAAAEGGDYAGFASIERNYSAVTGAAIAFRKDVFEALGGFDERFRIDYNDVDLCLRCIAAGYRVVYAPAATLVHFHNSSLQRRADEPGDRAAFCQRWSGMIARDPYYSRYFQRQSQDLPVLASGDARPADA